MSGMDNRRVERLWNFLTGGTSGDRKIHWEPGIIDRFPLSIPHHTVELIPAIRRISDSGIDPSGYDGTGIINRLAKLQNPAAEDQSDKLKFEAINAFLREVTDRPVTWTPETGPG